MSHASSAEARIKRARKIVLRELIEKLQTGVISGVSLEPYETLEILQALHLVRAGLDPRPYFGVDGPGCPEPHHARNGVIAACFLKLRRLEPAKFRRQHYARLADFTGLSANTIRDIVREYSGSGKSTAAKMSAQSLEQWLAALVTADASGAKPTPRLFPVHDV